MSIVWVVSAARYRDTKTGRFLTESKVRGYVQQSTEASAEVMKSLGLQVSQGTISKAAFIEAMKNEIKQEAIRQYVAGRGGVEQMTQADWGRVGRQVRDQYSYLSGFADDLTNLSEAETVNRASLYADSLGSLFERGHQSAIRVSGSFTEEYWQLGDAEHCADCESLNSKGWVPIGGLGTVPRAGATACLMKCQCHIIYR